MVKGQINTEAQEAFRKGDVEMSARAHDALKAAEGHTKYVLCVRYLPIFLTVSVFSFQPFTCMCFYTLCVLLLCPG